MTFDLEKARACAAFVEPKDAFLEALDEIERLRGFETAARDLNNDLIRIAGERDELAARIQELEEALVRERAKTLAAWCQGDCGEVVCDMIRHASQARQQLQAEGKIGPDATPKIKRCYSCGRSLDEIDCDNFTCCDCAPSWQITDERIEAFGWILHRLEYDQSLPGHANYKIQRAMELLRAMLLEAGQEIKNIKTVGD